ncbi:gamma-glutamyltransferase family protein [Sphingomonas nostoxanthinifaciens]|uniref:gamma-glutamyltransferase family protein n=1 Tax=Sphingomonas nostoxanthinifaciens TaxID=2872652 RepID=UPI001CC1CB5A|nr:gamma-glutamyltransferase [Sphingomonas nostoxanthinifaciens]UAK23450.1 gamma-glutamyltransferase [Sphingomonas nostoxanthinifaciens]
MTKIRDIIAAFAVAGLALPAPLLAQEQGPKPAVKAAHAMASSSNPIVTKAMVEVMRKGGTALDAVLTAVPMQSVIEPQMVTLAGGVSILYYEAKSGKYYYLDSELDHTKDAIVASGWSAFTGGGDKIPETSGKRVGVPGTVAGIKAAADRFGTLKWADYFQPAIDLATKGYPMYSFLYAELADAAQTRLSVYPSGREEYIPSGYPSPVGTLVTHPRLAAAMKHIQAEGPAYIYSGEWAHHFVDAVRATGGGITLDDLAQYKSRWEEPVRSTFNGYEIISAPPPSTAGTLIGLTLNVLENYDLRAHPYYADSAASLEMVRRAFGIAETATDEYVRDPLTYNVPTAILLSKPYAKMMYDVAAGSMPKAPATADANPHTGMELAGSFVEHDRHSTDTDHVVAIDKDGNMASVTHSVYGSTFATGLVVDGIAMNSGNNFPGNTAGPGRRAVSPFPPTMIAKDGKPWMTIGSPGLSSRAVTIALINLLGYGKTLEQSVDAPRFQGSQAGVPFVVEARVPEKVRDELKTVYGVMVRPTTPYMWHFGSVQAIQRMPDGTLLGVADPRRAGLAAGY